MEKSPPVLDALVVGAGPAGLGSALALAAVKDISFGVLERGRIGQTFLDWPEKQTFLTPSFTGNGFGATDLNAIRPETSPAYSLGVDYPTGPQYARYLRSVAAPFHLPVLGDAEVTSVTQHEDGFEVQCARGRVVTRSLVWAGGEFHHPLEPRMSGSGLADHSRTHEAWKPREGRVLVIGGYESGIDIACHHLDSGATVRICDGETPWDAGTGSDPSFRLAPRSRGRLAAALATGAHACGRECRGHQARRQGVGGQPGQRHEAPRRLAPDRRDRVRARPGPGRAPVRTASGRMAGAG